MSRMGNGWLVLAAFVLGMWLVGCGGSARSSTSTATKRPAASSKPKSPRHSARRLSPARGRRISLSATQLAGQRVIYSYRGLAPPASLISRIEAGEAAGVIFFANNVSSSAQIRQVTTQLQQAAAKSPVKAPLLLMTDQEGGEVRRLPGAPLLSEKDVGAGQDAPALAASAGEGAALNVRSVGMDVNLAPVLDVYDTAGNFVDHYGRSYSSDPRRVAALGADFIKAQQKAGVAATAKHFPGLGKASLTQDTDSEPVTLEVPLASLRSVDELPYESAIRAGVKLVMLSWAVYPSLDPARPAGLSPGVVQSELRGRLGFTGVTITDALEAGALTAYGSTSNRAVLAAGAGMDLLLCASQDPSQGTTAVSALASALKRGELSRSSFLAAVDRVVTLRKSLGGSS